jgi:CBS domain-containing protein
MKIRDLMKPSPEFITADATVVEAARKMRDINTGVLPVVEGAQGSDSQRPIGVLTDRDITIRATAEGKNPEQCRVENIFTRDTVFCYEEDTIANAFEKMVANDVGRLLVKSRGEALAGIISMADILGNAPEQVIEQLQSAGELHKNSGERSQSSGGKSQGSQGRLGDDNASRSTQRESERIQDRVGELA